MNISLLGTGLMGYPMAERILQFGHRLTVYNRTKAKAQPLKARGAYLAQLPEEAIKGAECIILMLADHKAIEEALLDKSESEEAFSNKTIIQMGTIAPTESIEIQKKVFERGGEYLECPVLGSRTEAAEGTLILMVGATEERFQKWQELLKIFGPNPQYIGEVGKAAALKLALNHLIAAHATSFSLSLGLIEKNEIDPQIFLDILSESALFAPMFEKKLARWVNRDYDDPNFPTKHLLKDVELILKEAEDKNLSTDVLEAIRKVLFKTTEKGLGDQDYSSVFNAINNI